MISLFYVTAPDLKTAQTLGKNAVENKLAACANIFPIMQSIYHWGDSVETSEEAVLILKDPKDHFEALEKWLHENHPYDVPCLIELPAGKVSTPYLSWLNDSLK